MSLSGFLQKLKLISCISADIKISIPGKDVIEIYSRRFQIKSNFRYTKNMP